MLMCLEADDCTMEGLPMVPYHVQSYLINQISRHHFYSFKRP